MMKSNVALLSVVSLVVLSACPAPFTPSKTPAVTDIGTPLGTGAVSNMIGASGGSVKSVDGKLELVIPAGAVSTNTAISITPITATGPGARLAWRLGPEGTTFASPVTNKFTATEPDLAGTEMAALRIATQNAQRQWESPNTTVSGNTISVTTTHFSDWSLLTGWQITPGEATVQPNGNKLLTVKYCHRDTNVELVPIVATCQEDAEIASLLGVWSVNGVERGDSNVGTVVSVDTAGSYTAPSKPPPSNPVAVSVDFSVPSQGKVTLVANIKVQQPGYAGMATWRSVTSNTQINGTVSNLQWDVKRVGSTDTSYTATGTIEYTYTQTTPMCDPFTATAPIEEGEMVVYSTSAIPLLQSRYTATFRATPRVTAICQDNQGNRMPVSIEVPLIFQVGLCSSTAGEPWTDISKLEGMGPCGSLISTSSWTWTRVQ